MIDTPSDRRRSFDDLFADNPDPWNFATSDYEQGKRQATLAALGPRRFAAGLEVGSATGFLAHDLLSVCDTVRGIDVSGEAVALARNRFGAANNLGFEQCEVPEDWPTGVFDLIVFSEILYFLSREEIGECAIRAWQTLPSGGTCLLVNWTGQNDLPVKGGEAADLFRSCCNWTGAERTAHENYRIDALFR